MTDNLDVSLNTSKKSLLCNHCMYDCGTYEYMREHYRSDFHKYNLNRVTMNLNPLTFQEYTKKKEMYLKIHESKAKAVTESPNLDSLKCEICIKQFSSANKFNEHMSSRAHKKAVEDAKSMPTKIKSTPKNPEDERTTKDDVTICLFCNKQSSSVENNIVHMIDEHKFDVPLIFCLKNPQGMLRLMAKKIVTYVACLTCDAHNFKNYKALQNHMMDKQHTRVNDEDLEEFLYKFYDKKSLLSIKDKNLKRLKEYKILKIKLKMKKIKKTKKKDEEGWETASDEEETTISVNKQEIGSTKISKIIKDKDVNDELDQSDTDDEYEPVSLPNGELLLENGTIVGNKIYQIYYKQRFHQNKYQGLVDSHRINRIRSLKVKKQNRVMGPKVKYYTVRDSNKSSFERVNTLFRACKQVNV